MKLFMATMLTTLLVVACLQPGEQFNYKMNRDRTVNLIRDAKMHVKVLTVDDVHTSFELYTWTKPIVGRVDEQTGHRVLLNDMLTQAYMNRLRLEEVIQMEDYRVTYLGSTEDGCDKIKVDEITADVGDLENLVVVAVGCLVRREVPQIDVEFDTRGQHIKIGYDFIGN